MAATLDSVEKLHWILARRNQGYKVWLENFSLVTKEEGSILVETNMPEYNFEVKEYYGEADFFEQVCKGFDAIDEKLKYVD